MSDNLPSLRAANFEKSIPEHLRTDALLRSVVEQLRAGGTFSPESVRFVEHYKSTALWPMTPEEFAKKMTEVLS